MTPNGQIATPLDKDANREPFLERRYSYPALAFAEVHKHSFDVLCAQFDTLLRTKRPKGIRDISVIPIAIVTGQPLPEAVKMVRTL